MSVCRPISTASHKTHCLGIPTSHWQQGGACLWRSQRKGQAAILAVWSTQPFQPAGFRESRQSEEGFPQCSTTALPEYGQTASLRRTLICSSSWGGTSQPGPPATLTCGYSRKSSDLSLGCSALGEGWNVTFGVWTTGLFSLQALESPSKPGQRWFPSTAWLFCGGMARMLL